MPTTTINNNGDLDNNYIHGKGRNSKPAGRQWIKKSQSHLIRMALMINNIKTSIGFVHFEHNFEFRLIKTVL